MNKLKIFNYSFVFIAMLAFALYSCQKKDLSVTKLESELSYEQVKQRAIQATKERNGDVTASVIFPKKAPASSISYVDANGQLISTSHNGVQVEAVCGQYTCGTAPNASDLYVVATLEYIKWYYSCGVGHDLSATWTISAPYDLLLQHPGNSAYSFGNIRIKTSGGSVLTTSGNLGSGNLTIENLGTDPNCNANDLFRVIYTWHDVSDTYFPGNLAEAQLTVYNDCSLTSNTTVIGWSGAPPYSTSSADVFTGPCDRTDQAWVNPYSGPNNCATIAGAYVVCAPPFGFQDTDAHQIEYREIDNGLSFEWDQQTSTVFNGHVPASGTPGTYTNVLNAWTDVLELEEMKTGDWMVRYRNRYNPGCNWSGSDLNLNVTWNGPWHLEIWLNL
jgi:hypothetical protein